MNLMFRKYCWAFLLMFICSVLSAQEEGTGSAQREGADAFKFEPGEQVANSILVSEADGGSREIGFWIYTPANYEEQELLPWMMFLHGMGERGDDLELVKKWGPPKLLADLDDFPFILISPQCPKDIGWKPSHLTQILDAVQSQMNVDKKRLYVTGLSMGGYGTWSMLGAIPDRIAAAVPVCGGGRPGMADQMIAVPVWAFHGDADRVVPLEESKRMVDAVNDAGGNAKMKVYEGVGHNSWTETYSNDAVYRWLLEHTLDR